MAPEVVKNPLKDHPDDFKNETRFHYNAVVDSWAVGCLAYELIVGFPPFMAETQQQVVTNINSMEVKYPKKMSDECVEFVKAALQRNPEDRATSQELIRHPWITLHMVCFLSSAYL
jgi:serine/threonine protein kinase